MNITTVRIPDYPFQFVEEVMRGEVILGLIEEQVDGRYKVFVGSGFSCRYLTLCKDKRAAVEALKRAAGTI